VVAATAAAVMLPAPAGGLTGDSGPLWLGDLTGAVEAEIEMLTSAIPLPDDDLDALRRDRVAQVDLFIGTTRVEAANRVAGLFSEFAVDSHSLLESGPGELFRRAGRVGGIVSHWRVATLESEWQDLDALIAELREAVADVAPVRVCPVSEGESFEDDWADARPWGRVHKGNDFHAQLGSPLAAIEAGTVVQANWHRSGGRQIYFRADSTGDVYYYSQLEAWSEWIWAGTRVEAGDVIGTVGSSGNADIPHLHFGWMPGSGTVDLANLQNPYRLLVALCT
jgi:murein DD-endopeptidase MepM/ murein hydrolase activator NlpD